MRLKHLTLGLICLLVTSPAYTQPFTYQGYLREGGLPANGTYQMTFRLFNVASGGTALATVGPASVSVSNGLFTHELNFGNFWTGPDRWLEIDVNTTTLSPRVHVRPAPYALFAFRPWQGNGTSLFYNDGNVGIGVSNPSVRLHVLGSIRADGGEFQNWGSIVFHPDIDNTGDDIVRFLDSVGNETMRVHSDGNVGIGTNNPLYRLHVLSGTSTRAIFALHSLSTGESYGGWFESSSTQGTGLFGRAIASTGDTRGVMGVSISSNGAGVAGFATASSGICYGTFGQSFSPSGYGVYSSGRLAATGTKSFQIDHPLRPETHYLNHFCAEGPEPYNLYRGTVVLDTRGEAWVQLPDYFEAINRDPSYHLTPIGAPMPNLHVAMEIQGNRFKMAGGVPGKKVSWEVKAIRNDRWVQRYGYQTEQEKEDAIKGKYIHPELYGQPEERGIHYRPDPAQPK